VPRRVCVGRALASACSTSASGLGRRQYLGLDPDSASGILLSCSRSKTSSPPATRLLAASDLRNRAFAGRLAPSSSSDDRLRRVPLFFFASEYAQISLGESGLVNRALPLIFLPGSRPATQWVGKMRDHASGRCDRCVLGCRERLVGFFSCAAAMYPPLGHEQWYYIVLAGSGVWLVLLPPPTLTRSPVGCAASTASRPGSPRRSATFGSSLVLAILSRCLIHSNRSNWRMALRHQGWFRVIKADRCPEIALPGGERLPGCLQRARVSNVPLRVSNRRADVLRRCDQRTSST